jgi:phage-related protein
MPGKAIWPGKKFRIEAWIGGDRRCQFEDFLVNLKTRSRSDWTRIVSLIAEASEHGPPEDEEQCRLVDGSLSNDLYEFLTRGGVRVFWFYYGESIVICLGALMKKKDKSSRTEIEKALLIKRKYIKEKKS